ncbi:hypothetical protein LCGC14_2037610 [marine sediment metagenome]|uniref:Peptidoglycan recognition protein family domain-containing protein n=1 Tax=marine sediment metagenome TaxID=412755 RepID=A0A0F9ESP1_9ZZZZ
MLKIAPGVQYLSRREWGADESLPRLGQEYPADVPTEAIQHHTVIIDNDATPNLWESAAEVIPKMRQLQTIRPDLGLDVPYSYVAFLMQYTHKKGLILCEGRGPYRRGAHTKYHNRTGRAMAIEGNTSLGAPLANYIEMLSWAWGWIKEEHGLVNLGTVTTPRGGIVFGHRDFLQTICPGQHMMNIIDQLTLTPYQQEDDMTAYRMFQSWVPARTWIIAYVADVPIYRRWIVTQTGAQKLIAALGQPETIDLAQLSTIPAL